MPKELFLDHSFADTLETESDHTNNALEVLDWAIGQTFVHGPADTYFKAVAARDYMQERASRPNGEGPTQTLKKED